MGPEVLVARPFLVGSELQALLVAAFDFRSLLPYVSTPGDLVVRTPEVLVWSGDLFYEDTPLAGYRLERFACQAFARHRRTGLRRKRVFCLAGPLSGRSASGVRHARRVDPAFLFLRLPQGARHA